MKSETTSFTISPATAVILSLHPSASDNVAQAGGFILNTGAVSDHAKAENLTTAIQAGKAYGVYR